MRVMATGVSWLNCTSQCTSSGMRLGVGVGSSGGKSDFLIPTREYLLVSCFEDTKLLRKLLFQALSFVSKQFDPHVSMLFCGGHEQFPGNQHFPNQHRIGEGGVEVTAVEFTGEK